MSDGLGMAMASPSHVSASKRVHSSPFMLSCSLSLSSLLEDPLVRVAHHDADLWVYTLEGKIIRDCLEVYPTSAKLVNKTNTRWMIARMIVRAARVVKEVKGTTKVGTGTGGEPLEVLSRNAGATTEKLDDGVAAAKRFAAQEAVRQSMATSESDRISNLERKVNEILTILHQRLPPAVSTRASTSLPQEQPLPGSAEHSKPSSWWTNQNFDA
jgi:hypothetical protein